MSTQIKALIIEDTPDHAELIRLELYKIRDCVPTIVGCMRDARDELDTESFDVILSDLNLPDSDRFQTVRLIKELAPHTPLLILTGDEVDPDGNDSIMLGAQEFLRKDELTKTRIDRVICHAIERQRILNENMALAEELHTNNLALERAKKHAESAMRAKAEFFANMSHEIRTPLTSILGFADIAIESGCVDPESESARALDTVRKNGQHLLSLVNNILDVAKVDAGAVELELIPSRVVDIVDSCIDMVSPLALEKGIQIQFAVSDETPNELLLDPTRLNQIIVNLLGNAIKFTNDGTITIAVSSTPYDESSHRLSIEIRDMGIGIHEDELSTIREFGAFSQANASTTRRFGGSGLGLRISQGLAKLMDGSIEIDSEFGIGSTFTLSIKASAPALASNSDQVKNQIRKAPKSMAPDLSGLRVLVVDDSPDNCRLFSYYLLKSNAFVESVCDGSECVRRVLDPKQSPVDLVLMDLQMPVLDGHSAFEEIRNRGGTVPIYATSASTGVEDRVSVTNAGFSGFIPKPVDPQELLKIARSVLDDRDSQFNAA